MKKTLTKKGTKRTWRFVAGAAMVVGISSMLNAQITLTGVSNSKFVLTDTFIQAQNFATFKSLGIAKANANWDVTGATVGTTKWKFERFMANSTSFPNADFKKIGSYTFAGSMKYSSSIFVVANSTKVGSLGEEIESDQVLSLALVTGGANDQLVFPKQVINFTQNEVEQVFPMTYNDNFSSNISFTTKFNLTVEAYGLNNTPGERRSSRTTRDTVIGWGNMKVKPYNKSEQQSIPVLQLAEWTTTVDSFYLGGNLAPTQLLAAFGLTQGQVSESRVTRFFRPDELNPLVELHHYGNTDSILRMDVQQDRYSQSGVGIKQVQGMFSGRIYPNPTAGNSITLERTEGSGQWSYSIVDLLGRTLLNGDLNNLSTSIDVAGLKSGNYFVRVQRDGIEVNSGTMLAIQ